VVEEGFAVTLAPVVELNPVGGDHVYVPAPPAVSVVFCPVQIETLGDSVITGIGFTVTVTWAVAVHPNASPVTVYVVVEEGFAVTLVPVVALNAVDGLHEYVLAPPAVNVVDCPAQRVTAGETVTTGTGLTITVTCAEPVHPLMSPMTVYVVVLAGVDVTDEPVELLNEAEGLHVYVFAPLAASVVDCPAQIVAGETDTMG